MWKPPQTRIGKAEAKAIRTLQFYPDRHYDTSAGWLVTSWSGTPWSLFVVSDPAAPPMTKLVAQSSATTTVPNEPPLVEHRITEEAFNIIKNGTTDDGGWTWEFEDATYEVLVEARCGYPVIEVYLE